MSYNISLAHHLNAMHGAVNENGLLRAKLLYEQTLRLQIKERVQLAIVHNICVVNNLAMVHLGLKNVRKSRECLGYVVSDVMYLVERGENHIPQQLEGFIRNVMPLILQDPSAAPAA